MEVCCGEGALWREVIKWKDEYEMREWRSQKVGHLHGMGVWKAIMKGRILFGKVLILRLGRDAGKILEGCLV